MEKKKKKHKKQHFWNFFFFFFLRLIAVQIELKEKCSGKFGSSDKRKSNIWNMFLQGFPSCFAQAAFYWAFPESEERLGDSHSRYTADFVTFPMTGDPPTHDTSCKHNIFHKVWVFFNSCTVLSRCEAQTLFLAAQEFKLAHYCRWFIKKPNVEKTSPSGFLHTISQDNLLSDLSLKKPS